MHVDYSMKMVLPCDQEAFREVIRDRKIGYVSGADYRKFEQEHPYVSHFHTFLSVEDESMAGSGDDDIYLFLSEERESAEKENSEAEESIAEWNGLIKWIDEEDIVRLMRGRSLVFQVAYIEEHGNVEEVIRRKFFERVFLLRDDKEDYHFLYDDFYDVRIFLQRIEGETVMQMKPVDIRGFDINTKILQLLREESLDFLEDGWNDFTAEFNAISDGISAQYFLTRYHSNILWSLNPVCIFCFRIAAFILPGKVAAHNAAGLLEEKLAINYKTGDKYVIDSIHFNSDICEDFAEFKELIENHYYDVTLA